MEKEQYMKIIEKAIELCKIADNDKIITGNSYIEFGERSIEVIDPNKRNKSGGRGFTFEGKKYKIEGNKAIEEKEFKLDQKWIPIRGNIPGTIVKIWTESDIKECIKRVTEELIIYNSKLELQTGMKFSIVEDIGFIINKLAGEGLVPELNAPTMEKE